MKKRIVLICVILALFMLVGCATLQNLIGQPQETYTFNYNGDEYSALLPSEVPLPGETASMKLMCYFWLGPLCVMHVRYAMENEFPQLSFWFIKNRGVLALVNHYMKNDRIVHMPYIYVKGLPIKVSGDEINQKLKDWCKPPKQ